MLLLTQLDVLLAFAAIKAITSGSCSASVPRSFWAEQRIQFILGQGFAFVLSNFKRLLSTLSCSLSRLSFSQTYWPALQCLEPWQGHTVFSSSRSHWNGLHHHIYMNAKWSKLNFILSVSWDTQYFSFRCSQTKSLLKTEVFVQLYSVQPEILIPAVRYFFFFGVFLVCNESVSRKRQRFFC